MAGLVLAAATATHAQNVGIGTPTPNPAAALDITATGKGLLIPRLDSVARVGIASPPTGLMVFQVGTASPRTRTGFYYYAGGSWLYLPDKTGAGDNLGNHRATQTLTLNGNALALRDDAFHGLVYAPGPIDGPSLYGYGGGSLGYKTNAGAAPTSVLTWNSRSQVAVPQQLLVGTANANAGTAPDLTFGPPSGAGAPSGEGIGSARTSASINQYGLDFYTGYQKRLSLDNYGGVGIGTDQPTQRLDVNGRTRLRNVATATRLAADSVSLDLSQLNPGNRPTLVFGNVAGGEGIGSARALSSPNIYGLDFYTNSLKRLAVTNTGRVGIGTDQPAQLLDVAGNANVAGDSYVGGNVGINTTSPAARLDVNGTLYARGTLRVDANGTNTGTLSGPAIFFGPQTGGLEGIASKRTTGGNQYGLDFYTRNVNRLAITSSGNVGIGTDAPAQKLDVSGAALVRGTLRVDANNTNDGTASNATGLFFGASGGSSEFIASNRTGTVNQYGLDLYTGGTKRVSLTNGGQLGIGVTDPSQRLDVDGTARLRGLTTPGYVVAAADGTLGTQALGTGTAGAWSLTGNAGTDASTNFIGTTDASNFTVRVNNVPTAVFQTNGGLWVGLNTNGSSSVLLGAGAGAALSPTTGGLGNVLIGYLAGASTNAGTNTLVGYSAGRNTTGGDNVMLGFNASTSLASSSQNTLVGTAALSRATSGINNVALGASAGSSLTSGNGNTLLGASADVGSPNLSNATAIGANAVVGASNALVLGGTGTSAVSVGIGTPTPGSTLQVVGSVAARIRPLGGGATIADDDYTVLVTGPVTLPAPSAANTGRLYHLLNGNSNSNTVTGTFRDAGSNGSFSDFTLNNTVSGKGLTVQSDGTQW